MSGPLRGDFLTHTVVSGNRWWLGSERSYHMQTYRKKRLITSNLAYR